jgi:uncharacterized protein YtpQ (UPF0354 family)
VCALAHRVNFALVQTLTILPGPQRPYVNLTKIKELLSDYENTLQDAIYRLIYYSKSALHVSDDVFVHHQKHLTVFTVSGTSREQLG